MTIERIPIFIFLEYEVLDLTVLIGQCDHNQTSAIPEFPEENIAY
jgi:hypothetical protein